MAMGPQRKTERKGTSYQIEEKMNAKKTKPDMVKVGKKDKKSAPLKMKSKKSRKE